MSRSLLTLLLLAGIAHPATGQTVKLPSEVKVAPGRLAAVAVDWDGDDVRWDVPPELDCFREYDPDPRKVKLRLIGYTPGRFRLLAVAAKGGKLSEFSTCAVVVEGTPPVPPTPPGPNPPVPPTPPTPDTLGFVALARTEGGKVPGPARALAKELADNFEAVSAQLAANFSMTVDQANTQLRDKNRVTLGANVEAWRPWFVAWQKHMDAHNGAGRSGKEHYVQSFKDTATGLRAAALTTNPWSH